MQDDFPSLAPSWFGRSLKAKSGDRDQQAGSTWGSKPSIQAGSTSRGSAWSAADDDAVVRAGYGAAGNRAHVSDPWNGRPSGSTHDGKVASGSHSLYSRPDTRSSDRQTAPSQVSAGSIAASNRNRDFPALTDLRHPQASTSGYAPKEAPYKRSFLASSTGPWTSALAEAPAAVLGGARIESRDSSGSGADDQDARAGAAQPGTTGGITGAGSAQGWRSVAAGAAASGGRGSAAAAVASSSDIKDKIKEQMEARQARLLPKVASAASGSRAGASTGSSSAARLSGMVPLKTAAQVVSTPSTGSHLVPLTHGKLLVKPVQVRAVVSSTAVQLQRAPSTAEAAAAGSGGGGGGTGGDPEGVAQPTAASAAHAQMPSEEETAFLKSLGWDGGGEGADDGSGDAGCEALTESEIAAFRASAAAAAASSPMRAYSPPPYGTVLAAAAAGGALPWVPMVPGPPLRVVPLQEGRGYMACISAPTSSPIAVPRPTSGGLVAPPDLGTLFATSIGTQPLLSDSDDD
uniref:Uncharacterized protein n=1 Tax=Chlamydomonas leiostraca TaxID=1034604 RepID=A0A7S0RYI3_9CHLO|mmetsp:Transcript_34615/g.87583  ORF Transcript_34615/g.87583 Transcript_34615/m.87583 type:complete len:517 (+) Transcript_34615:264-1814(+)